MTTTPRNFFIENSLLFVFLEADDEALYSRAISALSVSRKVELPDYQTIIIDNIVFRTIDVSGLNTQYLGYVGLIFGQIFYDKHPDLFHELGAFYEQGVFNETQILEPDYWVERLPYIDDNIIDIMLGPETFEFESFMDDFVKAYHLQIKTFECFECDGHCFYAIQFEDFDQNIVFRLSFEYGAFMIRKFRLREALGLS